MYQEDNVGVGFLEHLRKLEVTNQIGLDKDRWLCMIVGMDLKDTLDV